MEKATLGLLITLGSYVSALYTGWPKKM